MNPLTKEPRPSQVLVGAKETWNGDGRQKCGHGGITAYRKEDGGDHADRPSPWRMCVCDTMSPHSSLLTTYLPRLSVSATVLNWEDESWQVVNCFHVEQRPDGGVTVVEGMTSPREGCEDATFWGEGKSMCLGCDDCIMLGGHSRCHSHMGRTDNGH